jgi:hypothetical protein
VVRVETWLDTGGPRIVTPFWWGFCAVSALMGVVGVLANGPSRSLPAKLFECLLGACFGFVVGLMVWFIKHYVRP